MDGSSLHRDAGSDDEDDRPLAVRRKRRNASIMDSPRKDAAVMASYSGMHTPPATPQRSKKRVRFSDPGPLLSTGLTPFVSKTSLRTPSTGRRRSLPFPLQRAKMGEPLSGTIQFAPLRQVLDGRVTRRLRRNRLSEEVNEIEYDKKQEGKARREVELLKEALRQKDLEIAQLRDEQDLASQIGEEAGVVIETLDTDRIRELECEVAKLRRELEHREETVADWTIAARDPFEVDGEDVTFNQEFSADMTDVLLSTPCRRGFMSPPETAPNTPLKPLELVDASMQVSLRAEETLHLEQQLESLQSEAIALKASLELTNGTHERLAAKLSTFGENATDLDSALDTVLTQLALSQSASVENAHRFSALSTEICKLGIASRAELTISTLQSQFRQARLDLEYLHPGESTSGFDNATLLDLLINRLRFLTEKVKEQESDVDQYHEQELLLRHQLRARVDGMNTMHAALTDAQTEIMTLTSTVAERDGDMSKLTSALESYRNEVASLETLVMSLETSHAQATDSLQTQLAQQKRTSQTQLDVAAQQVTSSQTLIDAQTSSLQAADQRLRASLTEISTLNSQLTSQSTLILSHGSALALRDARVTELRAEIVLVNDALRTAHDRILELQATNEQRLAHAVAQARKEARAKEMQRGRVVVERFRERLVDVLELAKGYFDGCAAAAAGVVMEDEVAAGRQARRLAGYGDDASKEKRRRSKMSSSLSSPVVVINPSSSSTTTSSSSLRMLDGALARRSKGKKRRSYDSGLGFLAEEEEAEEEGGGGADDTTAVEQDQPTPVPVSQPAAEIRTEARPKASESTIAVAVTVAVAVVPRDELLVSASDPMDLEPEAEVNQNQGVETESGGAMQLDIEV